MSVEHLLLDSEAAFNAWLDNLHSLSNERYVFCSKKGNVLYFNCQRSGFQQLLPTAQRQRSERSKGSNKMNAHCTAQIIVKSVDSQIKISHFKTHCFHTDEIQFASIDRITKNQIIFGERPPSNQSSVESVITIL
jgi:ABC-type xylose transport system substrate-binding protein